MRLLCGLRKTRRDRMLISGISLLPPYLVMDTFANSFPAAIERVEQIALSELPKDASQEDKDACKIDLVKGDMRDRSAFKDIFAKYTGADAIYAVILVAALKAVGESGEIPIE